MAETNNKKVVVSGDTPTGRLHLGHLVGSQENRLKMQEEYDCYFFLANVHAFTTNAANPEQIRQNTLAIAVDYLACGIDPEKSTLFIQSEIPAIAELTFFLSMLLPYPRVMRNPTIKDEIVTKKLGDNYPFGFLLYAVGQIADILAFRAHYVPVGEDQIPHLEMAREVARRFNQLYCGVDSHTEDEDYVAKGGLFPIIEAKVGRNQRLVGTTGPNENGQLLKMSKSLNNAILITESPDELRKKVFSIYTDPKRIKATDPGTVENNPLWIFHDTFNSDKDWVDEAKLRYQEGKIGDVECKKKLFDVLLELIEPMYKRRVELSKNMDYVQQVLKNGCEKANAVAEKTLQLSKEKMKQDYFDLKREIKYFG